MAERIPSHLEFMRRFFPKEYAKRKAEGRCLHCGAKRPRSPLAPPRKLVGSDDA